MMFLTNSWSDLKLGHVRFISRSLDQVIENPCDCSKGHIDSLIKLKLAHNVVLDKISKSKNGSYGVKK